MQTVLEVLQIVGGFVAFMGALGQCALLHWKWTSLKPGDEVGIRVLQKRFAWVVIAGVAISAVSTLVRCVW